MPAETTQVEDLVRQSRFIFNGTIQKLNAANLSAVTDTTNTAIVQVDEVLQVPPTLGNYAGRGVTVLLNNPQRAKEGQQAVFFANSWLYGENLALVEVAHLEGRQDLEFLRGQIADADQRIADDALRARLGRAELVVVGRVAKIQPATERSRVTLNTEHAPDWWEALVGVEFVEKGQLRERQVVVIYPNSADEMWIDAPKFRIAQDGIWILQRDQQEKGWPVMRVPGYTALDPLDFQPRSQLNRIRSLLKS